MSHEALSPDQFHFAFHRAEPNSMYGSKSHTLKVVPEGGLDSDPVGSLDWHHKTGEITNIHVGSEYRRQGIATAMYQHAQEIASTTPGVKPVRHSSDRTDAGDVWAKSLGGRVPKRKQVGSDPEYFVPESVRRSEQ